MVQAPASAPAPGSAPSPSSGTAAAVQIGRALDSVPAPGLVIAGMCGLQGGAALASGLFPKVGAPGVVLVRLGFAGILLGALWRPRVRWNRRELAAVCATGTLLAIHHLCYYQAVARIPLGEATTVEFLGPFALSLISARRPITVLWSLLALSGVVLLSGDGAYDKVGFLFAAIAGACWASYIVVSSRLARKADSGQALALAVAWGALISLPYGLARAGTQLFSAHVLLLGLAVAVLSSVLPYSFNLAALRRIPPRTFAILSSLEPAVGALIGLIFLSQSLGLVQWTGVAAVVAASVGASARDRRKTNEDPS